MTEQTRLEELLAECGRLRAVAAEAQKRLSEAEQALVEERFRGVAHYQRGDVILVPRVLFGKHKMWPAKVAAVHLQFADGVSADGEAWETKTVSYSVFLQQKDGGYGGTSAGVYHRETAPFPGSGAAVAS